MTDGKLSVLISAYACEPGKGSEPEVGWQWALQMARFHDVTVITRSNNRGNIEAALKHLTPAGGSLRFIYHDLSPLALKLKKKLPCSVWYYMAWQKSVRRLIQRLLAEQRFDLLHHVTYAAARYPEAVSGHGVPCLWGPVGGVEDYPWRLLSFRYPFASAKEAFRNILNYFQTRRGGSLALKVVACDGIIASNREMRDFLEALAIPARMLPTVGIDANSTGGPELRAMEKTGPLRLLYVGNLLFLKGLHLGLEALQRSGTDATLTLIGDGPFRPALQSLVATLGLGGRVQFCGRRPREEVFAAYRKFDAFLFPSLHDSGGFAVLEAMNQGLPIICVDRGGPSVIVEPGCGWKIAPAGHGRTVADLAAAIRAADGDRNALGRMGAKARETVVQSYDWNAKGRILNEIYLDTVAHSKRRSPEP